MAPTLRARTTAAISASINSNAAGQSRDKVKKAKVAAKSKTTNSIKANGAPPKASKTTKKGKGTKAETNNEENIASADTQNEDEDEALKNAKSVYDFRAKTITGEEISLEKYRGHVLLIVNVASNCSYTSKNYPELVELDEKYRDSKGLCILAFPCNQFGKQEPGDSAKIMGKVEKYKVKFDMFEKIDVNGPTAHPLYKFLKSGQNGLGTEPIKWNFNKFIIDKEGIPVARFLSPKKPLDLIPELEKYW